MTPLPKQRRPQIVFERALEQPKETVLDLLDYLINNGAVLDGDLMLGVAGVDLIYFKLSALLCAADRRPGERHRAERPRRRRT